MRSDGSASVYRPPNVEFFASIDAGRRDSRDHQVAPTLKVRSVHDFEPMSLFVFL